DYSIDHDAERGGRAALAGRADAQGVRRGRYLGEFGGEERHRVGARHRVVHERPGQQLAAVAVIDDLFAHCLADTLDDAAMDLAVHDHRVDRPSDIVDRAVAHDLDGTGVGIDLDLADVAAI